VKNGVYVFLKTLLVLFIYKFVYFVFVSVLSLSKNNRDTKNVDYKVQKYIQFVHCYLNFYLWLYEEVNNSKRSRNVMPIRQLTKKWKCASLRCFVKFKSNVKINSYTLLFSVHYHSHYQLAYQKWVGNYN